MRTTRTIGELIGEARQLLNDTVPISGLPRFTDQTLVAAFNEGLEQVRSKRPDAFLITGMIRQPTPIYEMPVDTNVPFPINSNLFYGALLFYVVGRAELIEDTFADDGRAVTLMNKFTAQLLRVAS